MSGGVRALGGRPPVVGYAKDQRLLPGPLAWTESPGGSPGKGLNQEAKEGRLQLVDSFEFKLDLFPNLTSSRKFWTPFTS